MKQPHPGTGTAQQTYAYLDWMDQARNSCRVIESLAQLLEAAGSSQIQPQAVARVASLITDQTERLDAALDRLEAGGLVPARTGAG